MTEICKLQSRQAMLRGHCCVEYKDDITGKVLEKIDGDNHVFVDQFTGATNLYNYFRQPILLCEGGSSIPDTLPVIPGNPIGIGIPGNETYRAFRGAWRSSEAYIMQINGNAGVSSKHIYDFTAQQAIGSLKWLGLNIMNTSAEVPSSILAPSVKTASIGSNRIEDSKTGWMFYVKSTPTFQAEGSIVCFNSLSGAKMTIPLSLSTLGITEYYNTTSNSYNSICTRLVYDNENAKLYAICSYYKSYGVKTTIWVTFNNTFAAVESTESMDWLNAWTNYNSNAYNGVLRDNKILVLSPVTTPGVSYTETTIHLSEQAYATNVLGIAAGLQDCNLFYLDQRIEVCGDYAWWQIPHNGSYNSDYGYMDATRTNSTKFRCISPVYDLDAMSVVSYTPPLSSIGAPAAPRALKNPISTAPNQLLSGNFNTSYRLSYITGALTKYKIPDGAPERPEGSAMSITYDINLEW